MTQVTEGTGAFSAAEFDRRLQTVRAAMRERDLGALLVTTPENIYYLIGLSHQGYFAFTMLLLPLEGPPVLMSRAMEHVIIARQAPNARFVGYEESDDAADVAVRAIVEAGHDRDRIGVDTSSIFFPPGVWSRLEDDLSGVEWFDTSRSASVEPTFRAGLVDHIRLVKSDAELAYIRRAAMVSDRAARAGLAVAGVGTNEREVAAAIYEAMILGGGEYPGFVPLIRSGDTLREEHSTWRDRNLQAGDTMFIELSGASARYHAPLGRTAHIARAPDDGRARAIAVDALQAARATLRPGARSGDVYAAWQAAVDDGLGHPGAPRHHCGYNVGIGFPPSWVGSSTVLGLRPGGVVEIQAGMVFHLWAWISDPDAGDYLASDTAIVGGNETEIITTTSHPHVIGH